MNIQHDLELLKRAVDSAMAMQDLLMMHTMNEAEIAEYKAMYGDYDFIIGDFAVKRISGNPTTPPMLAKWRKENL